ncbi:MAG TPA: MFS transporter, partial [Porticoccaceae bacterium]
PAPIQAVHINFRRVWALSHVGVGGAIASGLATGAFWAMGPVFGRGLGLDLSQLAMFLSAAVLGGALFQLPLGRLSDRYDRRLVIFYTALGGAIFSLFLCLLPVQGIPLLVLALLWGGGVMTLYALCLAHATDHAQGDEFVMVGSGILMIFAVSSAIGAPLASLFMGVVGPRGLFAFAALCLMGLILGIAVRRRTHVLPIIDETGPFRPLAETSPALFEMDPRTEGADTVDEVRVADP